MAEREPKKRCFVISPIGEDKSAIRESADKVLRHLIRKALASDFDVERADADANPGEITPRMITSILEADLVVADLSGANPNVFYEVAIAHGFRRPTVHIQRAGEPLPFDVKDMRMVRYDIHDPDELEKNQKTLREYALFAISNANKLATPLSSAQRFASVQQSSDPIAQSNVQVLEALSGLRDEVRELRRTGASRNEMRRLLGLQEKLDEAKANENSLRMIVNRATEGRRLDPEDFRSVITNHTSVDFDDYVRHRLAFIMDTDDDDLLETVLFDPSIP